MNKISKKIVALVTMAAFVLTLVPFAAFGATTRSSVKVDSGSESITLNTSGEATANITLTIGSNENVGNVPVYVWLTKDDSSEIYRYADWTAANSSGTIDATNGSDGELVYALKIGKENVQAGTINITATVEDAGVYTVHAGIATSAGDKTSRSELSTINVSGDGTITVKSASTYVDSITVSDASDNTISYNGTPNGIRTTKVEATVTSKYSSDDTEASSDGKVLTVTSSSSQIAILNADGEETNEITVDGDTATFYLKAASGIREGNYTITLSADDVTYRLTVQIGTSDNTASTIEAVDTDQTVVAKQTGSDVTLEDVIQFSVANADGELLVPGSSIDGFTAYTDGYNAMGTYIDVIEKPEDCDPQFKVVKVSDSSDYYTLAVEDASELPVGEYTVRVSLDNGKIADFTFTVAKFGDVVDMIIDVDDTVAFGGTVEGTVKYVDENGLKKEANSSVAIGYTGSACDSDSFSATAPTFKVTAKDNENYIGSVITITAVDSNYGFIVTKDITVTDGVTEGTLEFDSTNGSIFKNNTVNVSVVDEDGNVLDIDGASLYAYVAAQGDETANITVTPSGTVNDGKGKLTLYSDLETTADVVVAVKADTGEIYAATLAYTFGDESAASDNTIIAMTLGSSDYIVNNEIVTGDAAPYVDSNWRTMVPIRVIAETFGAEVDYDDEARTVTIVDGDTTIVMTIDETTYTINGEEATMDTAPVIGSGDRTYVPVRFVAEALGYTVTPLYAADGTTASVVFQK